MVLSHSPRHSVIGSSLIGMDSLELGVEELIGFTRSFISSWKRFSGLGDEYGLDDLYVIPVTPAALVVFMLWDRDRFMVCSIELGTDRPNGEDIGLSRADSEGLILRSCMHPAGLLILRKDVMWLIEGIMPIGSEPLFCILLQALPKASEFTKLATGLVSWAELWLAAATMLHICCRRPWATAATAAAAAAGDTLGSEPSLQDELEKFWILAVAPAVFTLDVLTLLTES